jgi:hypothetical protein
MDWVFSFHFYCVDSICSHMVWANVLVSGNVYHHKFITKIYHFVEEANKCALKRLTYGMVANKKTLYIYWLYDWLLYISNQNRQYLLLQKLFIK